MNDGSYQEIADILQVPFPSALASREASPNSNNSSLPAPLAELPKTLKLEI